MFKAIYNLFNRHYHLRYHGVYNHAKKLFVFDLFLLATAIITLGAGLFFFFWNPGLTDQIDLKISLGSNRIKSGELVKVTIDYKNRSKYYLREPVLALHLPIGFVVDRELTPVNIFKTDSTFELPELRPGASGQAEVYGRLWVSPKQEEKISALLSYLPEKSNNREQKIGLFLVNLSDSILRASLELSTTSFANTRVPFVYKLINTSDSKLEGLNFNFNFPGTIIGLKNSDLQNITLEKNSEKLITGEIVIPNKSGEYSLNVIVGASINNQSINILNNQSTVKTFSPEISISAKLKDNPTFAQPNQTLNAIISWQNNGQYELQNSYVRIAFTPGVVDIKTTAKENGFKIDGNDLIVGANNLLISAKERTALSNGKPQANDQFDFKIYLLPTFNVGTTENAVLEIKPSFVSELKNISGQQFTSTGESAKIILATELSLKAESRYYTDEGDQLGRGPLPPQVGETTKYWIFIRANNTTNPVRDAMFSATLPNGVNFTGKQSVSIGPALTFDETNRTVSWNYRELPANSQTGLYFEVAVTPTPEQMGKTINLVNSIKFTASDKNIGKQFVLNKSVVNNVLSANDLGNKKSSLVQ
ncbi:MAG: hypothetical protein WCT11_02335 [Candidatus Magasanikbacteria bacterium]